MITENFLKSHGFSSDHPERPLGKYYLHSKEHPEYRIMVEQEYYPYSNILGYKIDAWKCKGDTGIIEKRASTGITNKEEDLQMIIDLCEIDLKII